MGREGKKRAPLSEERGWDETRSVGDRSTSGAEPPVRWPPDFIGQHYGVLILCVGDQVNTGLPGQHRGALLWKYNKATEFVNSQKMA